MTTPQPAALPELPEAFGYLCDWGNDSFGLTRQTVYYDEPGSATLDDWNEYPKVHENQPIYTAAQMRARDAMWAERLAALQPKLAHQGDQQCTNGTPNTSQQPHAAEQQNDTRTQSDGSAAQSVPGLFTRVDDFRNPAAVSVSDAEIRSVWLATADQIPHCEHYLHFAHAILALRPQAVPGEAHQPGESASYRDENDMPTEVAVLKREWLAMRKALSYRPAPPKDHT